MHRERSSRRRANPALVVLSLVAVLWGAWLGFTRGGPKGVRIVLVTVDTLRFDALDELGGGVPMERVAERSRDGTVLERCYAATPITLPTHASLLTGLHPWEHGVTANGLVLASSVETIAERLAAGGFATGAVVASFPLAPRFGLDRGFDVYDHEFDEEMFAGRDWKGHDVPEGEFYRLANSVTSRARRTIRRAGGSKQLFWIHYFDPHDPYGDAFGGETIGARAVLRQAVESPKELPAALARARDLYAADVSALDRSLDELLGWLERQSWRWDTHVVLTADHGESFGGDGSVGHGKRLTRQQIRVPCIIWSSRLAPGRDPRPAGSVHLAATLLELAGVDPGEAGLRSESVLASDRSGLALGMRTTFSAGRTEIRLDGTRQPVDDLLFYAARGEWGIVRGNADELLDGDRLPAVERDELRALFGSLEERLADAVAESADDPESLEALRALGYIQ